MKSKLVNKHFLFKKAKATQLRIKNFFKDQWKDVKVFLNEAKYRDCVICYEDWGVKIDSEKFEKIDQEIFDNFTNINLKND